MFHTGNLLLTQGKMLVIKNKRGFVEGGMENVATVFGFCW